MSREILPRIEWDFHAVPASQLVACCYWEYARESVSICDAVQYAKEAADRSGIPGPETPEREAFRSRVNEAYGLLHRTGFELPFWVSLPFPFPWQSVDDDRRAKWANVLPRDLSKVPGISMLAPFQVCGDPMIIDWLNSLARTANEKRAAAWREFGRCEAACEVYEGLEKLSEESRHPPPVSLMGIGGAQSFVGQINWADYTRPEIVAAFAKWVEENAPTTIPEPSDGSGHKLIDWEKKLRDLGVLRLMSFCTVAEMHLREPRGCPEAARFFESWESKHWSAARKRALRNFRSLLRFLPEGERPIHAPTKGGRAKM